MEEDISPRCYLCQGVAVRSHTVVDKDRTLRSYVCGTCPYPGHYCMHDLQELESGVQQFVAKCDKCGTSWEGASDVCLGCENCYKTFDKKLQDMLRRSHKGRSPKQIELNEQENSAKRLLNLNEELKETLAKEDYEKAALLRDQINQIKKQDFHE